MLDPPWQRLLPELCRVALPPAIGQARCCCNPHARLARAGFALDGGTPFGIDRAAHGVDTMVLRHGKPWKVSSRELLVFADAGHDAHLPVCRIELVERFAFLDHARSQGR